MARILQVCLQAVGVLEPDAETDLVVAIHGGPAAADVASA